MKKVVGTLLFLLIFMNIFAIYPEWDYYREININSATPYNNFQVNVILDTTNFNYANADFYGSDIRFADLNDSELNYWIEEWNNYGTSSIWVKVNNMSEDTILMFYGNSAAVSYSSASATFDEYISFETGNLADWTFTNSTNGQQIGSNAAGDWYSEIEDFYPIENYFSAKIGAVSNAHSSPWGVNAWMAKALTKGDYHLAMDIDMHITDAAEAQGANGNSLFIMYFYNENRSANYSYGFDKPGQYGDTPNIVNDDEKFTYTANFTEDFYSKNDTSLTNNFSLEFRAKADYAEYGSGLRKAETIFDCIKIRKYSSSDMTTNVGAEQSHTFPYPVSYGEDNYYQWIENVSFAGINNSTGQEDNDYGYAYGGYGDYTNHVANVTPGEEFELSLDIQVDYEEYVNVWIDWNNDSTFVANEEYGIVFAADTSGTYSQYILVPDSALVCTTRMRVSLCGGYWPAPDEIFYNGEVEDYSVYISGGLVATPGSPENPNPPDGATSVGTPVTLTWDFGLSTENYDLLFGTNNPPTTLVQDNIPAGSVGSYTPTDLANDMTYYWQVVAKNSYGNTYGDVWSFTTEAGSHIYAGPVSGDWDAAYGPYYIHGDIHIPVDATLTINPGVEVIFSDTTHCKFEIFGQLKAEGSPSDSITFTVADTTGYYNNTHTGWSGLRFINTATNSMPPSFLQNCNIEYGKAEGAEMENYGGGLYFKESSDVNIEYSKIWLCLASAEGGGAYLEMSSPSFSHVAFKNNRAESGGGITADYYSNFHFTKGTVRYNTANQKGGGIYLKQSSNPIVQNVLIAENTANTGVALAIESCPDPQFANLTVDDNIGGSSLYLENSNPFIKNSILYNEECTTELELLGSSFPTINYTASRTNIDDFGDDNIVTIPNYYPNTQYYKLFPLNSENNAKNPLIDSGNPADDFNEEPFPRGTAINMGCRGGTQLATRSVILAPAVIDAVVNWNNENMQIINQNFTIEPGATLNLDPGTQIHIDGDYALNINGELGALATRNDSIIFSSNLIELNNREQQSWQGINFTAGAAGASAMQNVIVENAVNGINVNNLSIPMNGVNVRFNTDSLDTLPQCGIILGEFSNSNIANCNIDGYTTGVNIVNLGRDRTSTPTLTNSRFRNNPESSREDAIGINISGAVAAQIDNCLFEGYPYGVKQVNITATRDTPTLTNSRFRSNPESSRQDSSLIAGIYLENVPNIRIRNDSIIGYTTGLKIINADTLRETSTPTLTNSRFRSNPESSRENATAIDISGNVAAQIDSCIVEGYPYGIKQINITAVRETPTLTNSRFRSNPESSRPDTDLITGIYLENVENIEIDNDSIIGYTTGLEITNTSRRLSTPTLTNSRFRSNPESSREKTYGIHANGPIAYDINNCYFDDYNYSVYHLGNGLPTRATPTLTNSRFRSNPESSRASEAAIFMHNVLSPLIDLCEIENYNSAIEDNNESDNPSMPTISNNKILHDNQNTRLLGSGLTISGFNNGIITNNEFVNIDSALVVLGNSANPRIKQNLFYFNRYLEEDIGCMAIYAENSTNLIVKNNTINAYDYGLISSNATVEFTNNIHWKKNPQNEPVTISDNMDVRFCDIARPEDAVYPGTGNINQDPMFYAVSNANFSLITGSPCIDAGNPADSLDPDSSVRDMGKYYAPYLDDFDAEHMFGANSYQVQFSESSSGFNVNNTTWSWDTNNDGSSDITGINPTFTYSSPGVYSVRLQVTKGNVMDELVKEKFIVIQEEQLPPPSEVNITIANTDIELQWTEIDTTGLKLGRENLYYIIYVSDDPETGFEYLNHVGANTTTYTHDNATEYMDTAFYQIIGFVGNIAKLQRFILQSKKHKIIQPDKTLK